MSRTPPRLKGAVQPEAQSVPDIPHHTGSTFWFSAMQRKSLQLLFICLFGLVLSLLIGSSRGDGVSNIARLSPSSKFPDLYEATFAELQNGMAQGQFTSVDLVKVGVMMFLIMIRWW